MSYTVSIFISEGPSIEECVRVLEDYFQVSPELRSNTDGRSFEAVIPGAFLSLFDNHGLVDDCGIEFTRYPLEIDFTRSGHAYSEVNALLSAAAPLAEALSRKLNVRCIVVDNLQRIVQTFGASRGEQSGQIGTGPIMAN
jgi:hypothetical protein